MRLRRSWHGAVTRPIFGTNPVAAIFPRKDGAPLVIDMSLTQVTRGQILLYANAGKPIPEGWGMDKEGNPTTDAHAIMVGGSLHAVGGLKGTMLAFAVEILCCALMGAALSHEVEPMLVNNGKPMDLGQAFLVIDPGALAGNERYFERVETLIAAMLEDEEVRLPGARRVENVARAAKEGIEIPAELEKQLRTLAAGRVVPRVNDAIRVSSIRTCWTSNHSTLFCAANSMREAAGGFLRGCGGFPIRMCGIFGIITRASMRAAAKRWPMLRRCGAPCGSPGTMTRTSGTR